MTTNLTKTELNTVLSALDGKPRNPNTKAAALKAIGRHAEAFGISIDDILSAAAGLLDGRQCPEDFRECLQPEPTATLPAVAEDKEPAPQAEAQPEIAPEGDVAADEAKPHRGRDGTKQAKMIAMLRRPEGATVDQIAAITGWRNHTIRGAIAGALKKKLGLTITAERVRSVGPNKEGGRGSFTVYRVIDAA
jgi:hypothetical protein